MKNCLPVILISLFFTIESTSQTHTVDMLNYRFEPRELHIEPGDTVIWVNDSRILHTATSGSSCKKNGIFNSGNVRKGESYRYVFDTTGIFPYFCIPHCQMDMKGTIYVGEVDTTQKVKESVNLFNGTRVINSHSTDVLRQGFMDFRVAHRWDDMAVERTGGHQLYGLDNIRDVRIAFEFGITDEFMIGLGRSKGDILNEVQDVREIFDLFGKYQFIQQNPDKHPFSFSIYANTAFSIMKSSNLEDRESHFSEFKERFSFVGQLLIGRKFFDDLSVQLMPTYIRRNWSVIENDKDLFSMGMTAKYMFTDLFGLIVEYFHVFDEFRSTQDRQFYEPLAIAAEFHTGLHVFHLNLTNSTGVIPNTFIPYTTQNWLDGEFRLGFSISRKFHL